MDPTNAVLIVTGVVCVTLSGFAVRQLRPREGRPESVWTRGENRATLVALGLLTLFVFGAGMILKGALS